MRVLHLFSNCKWTGPAEPALNLCVALRRMDVAADFACAPNAGRSVNMIVETARDRGVEPVLRFSLSKHRHPVKDWLDRRALRAFLRERAYDLVHCHLDNDHRIALDPAGRLGIPLIRSSYEGEGLRGKGGYGRLLAGTGHLIEPSDLAAEHDIAAYGYPRKRVTVIPGAVDVERFSPSREVPDGRRWLGIPNDAFVVGIVARMQTHRHYGDFLEAIRLLAEDRDNVHAVIVGRGTKQDTVAKGPARDMGLQGRIHFSGHIQGENYVGMLKACDANVYLVPGSDGTCRAVREAMAMARPVVTADRGMLREIVDDGVNGYVVDGSAASLHTALRTLANDRAHTRAMGRAAREKAVSRYSLEAQARDVLRVYKSTLELR